jgi:hypothetical protein
MRMPIGFLFVCTASITLIVAAMDEVRASGPYYCSGSTTCCRRQCGGYPTATSTRLTPYPYPNLTHSSYPLLTPSSYPMGLVQRYYMGILVATMPVNVVAPQVQGDRSRKDTLNAVVAPAPDLQMNWPLGLQILAPEENGGPRQRIDGIFQILAVQELSGQVDRDTVTEGKKAVDQLQRRVTRDKDRMGLTVAVHKEAQAFVNNLREVLRGLEKE